MASSQSRRSKIAVVVVVVGVGLMLTPLPPQVGLTLVVTAAVLVARRDGGQRGARA